MIKLRSAAAGLALGLTLMATASPAVARNGDEEARALGISEARAEALRACNEKANKFVQHTWGKTQGDQLRACMVQHGQLE
jgi:hypothetical protein